MAAMPPPPSYDSATAAQPPTFYQSTAPKSNYGRTDVEYTGVSSEAVISFSNKSVRRVFIRKVLSILSLQLLTTVAFISVFIFVEPVKKYFHGPNGFGIYMASLLAKLFLEGSWLCCLLLSLPMMSC